MIREEYEKELKNVKENNPQTTTRKRMSKKEQRQRAELGARGYIGKTINKTNDLIKALSFTTIASAIMLAIAYLMVLLVFFADKENSATMFYVSTAIMGAVVIWIFVWFLLLRPIEKRKIQSLKDELASLMEEERAKQLARYERLKRIEQEKDQENGDK